MAYVDFMKRNQQCNLAKIIYKSQLHFTKFKCSVVVQLVVGHHSDDTQSCEVIQGFPNKQ